MEQRAHSRRICPRREGAKKDSNGAQKDVKGAGRRSREERLRNPHGGCDPGTACMRCIPIWALGGFGAQKATERTRARSCARNFFSAVEGGCKVQKVRYQLPPLRGEHGFGMKLHAI